LPLAELAATTHSKPNRLEITMPHPLSPHRFTYSRRLVRLLATLSLTAGLVAVPTAVSAQTGTPYCNSYVSPTSQYGAGDVKVGMLTSNTGEPNGAVGWLWNIYAPNERAGLYSWQVYINGHANTDGGSRGELIIKDNEIHSTLQRITPQRVNWHHGDSFHLDATHLSEAGNITYITPVNYCIIP